MREAENFSFAQVRLDGRFVELSLRLVGRENLDPIGALGGFGWSDDRHAVGTSLPGGAALGIESDDDVVSAIAQILRLRVSLRTIAEYGNCFALQRGRIGIVLIEDCGHEKLLLEVNNFVNK